MLISVKSNHLTRIQIELIIDKPYNIQLSSGFITYKHNLYSAVSKVICLNLIRA